MAPKDHETRTAEFFRLPPAMTPRVLAAYTAADAAMKVERAPVGVVIIDAELRIVGVNAFARPFYRKDQLLVGEQVSTIVRSRWLKDTADEIERTVQEVLETGRPFLSLGFARVRRDLREKQRYHWHLHRVTGRDGHHYLACYFLPLGESVAVAR